MIFIKYDSDYIVKMAHFMPFDEIHGMGKTREELLKEGALVNTMPIPDNNLPFEHIYNPDNNTVSYRLLEKNDTEDSINEMENKISILEAENKALKEGLLEYINTNDSTKLIRLLSE